MPAAARAYVLVLAFGVLALGCGGGVGPRVQRVEHYEASYRIEEVTIRNGEVRVAGEIEVDPRAAEVELIDGECGRHVLGGGVWTRNRLVWRLSARDLGFALGCSESVGVRARDRAAWTGTSSGASSSFPVSLTLTEVEDEEHPRQSVTRDFTVSYDLDDAIVRVRVVDIDPASTILAVPGHTVGPVIASAALDVAVFRVKAASLVDAALRQQVIRITSAGRETRWLPTLTVANQTVTPEQFVETTSTSEG